MSKSDSRPTKSAEDQFKVKPREHNRYKYKYIFTGKHHDAIAKVIAEKYSHYALHGDAKAQEVVYALALDIAHMLELDNNRFNRSDFLKKTVI